MFVLREDLWLDVERGWRLDVVGGRVELLFEHSFVQGLLCLEVPIRGVLWFNVRGVEVFRDNLVIQIYSVFVSSSKFSRYLMII